MPEQASSQINWKRVGAIVVAAVVVLAILIFLWWWFFGRVPKEQPTTTVHPPVKQSTPSATPSAKPATSSAKKDETAGWKTYTGETILVSFKIPSNFSVKDQKGKIQNTYFEGLISVSDEKGESRFAIINSASGPMLYPLRNENILVDGTRGTKSSWVYYKDPSNLNLGPEDRTEPRIITISFSGKNFYINYEYSKDNEELMKKILSTFKFD